jgi:phytoene dehydrogenase-like protein
MDRFDAAVIGAGPEGLVAATTLARAGLHVVLLEKASEPGGRASTHQFHPGFRASSFADELPAIPSRLYRSLDLARYGAILVPSPASACISDHGASLLFADEAGLARCLPAGELPGVLAFRRETQMLQQAIQERASRPPSPSRRRWWGLPRASSEAASWPAGEWARSSLAEVLRAGIANPQLQLHLAADAVSGRAVSPFLAGTALHALTSGRGRSGQSPTGHGRVGSALVQAAQAAGVTIRSDCEVTNIQLMRGRATALMVARQRPVEAAAIVSTLDLKRTLLRLIHRSVLAPQLVKRVGRFRMAGQMARVMFGLDAAPDTLLAPGLRDVCAGPIHVVASMEALGLAHDEWRAGMVPHAPLVSLRLPCAADPRLAPMGKAVMTATLSGIPTQLFDGAWTDERRAKLMRTALGAAERAMPGISRLVLGHETMVGPDYEQALGASDGDLDGGELAPDQALGFRPFGDAEWQDGRTPVVGLYLGGASSACSPFLLGVCGERAALAAVADFKARRLR